MKKNDARADGVTARQWQYLFYLSTRRGRNKSVSICAAHFKISRQGAGKVFDILRDKGLVLREGDAITLTPKAREGLRPLTEQCEELKVFLKSAGYAGARAREEAIKMVYTFPSDTMEIITARFLAERVLGAPQTGEPDRALAALPDGVYPIYDFAVRKPDGGELSMGNDGFRRPAMFVSARGAYGLELRAKTIRRTLPSGEVTRGTLTKLQYSQNGVYTECTAFCERWDIPGDALTLTREGDAFVCRMRFLADAGPACKMPAKSEGLLVFTVSAESERLPLRAVGGKGKTRVASKRRSKADAEGTE